MDIPGPIAFGIFLGVALGVWVALAIIWPRARPPRKPPGHRQPDLRR
jgi:hypothetical protein